MTGMRGFHRPIGDHDQAIVLAGPRGGTNMGSMLEICIDSVGSAAASQEGGADRVELCANLPEGGTTPSAGMIHTVRGIFTGGLMVIIRPRGYDFLYSEPEMNAMLHDIAVAKDAGADGVVFGCLQADGRVDQRQCERLVAAADGLDMTFHRAFDMSRDLNEALEDIIGLGIKRILSSGGAPDVPAGISKLKELVEQAGPRASIMPGGGIFARNVGNVVRATGVHEIHLSARGTVRGGMTFFNKGCSMGSFSSTDEYAWRETDAKSVRMAKAALTEGRL